MLSDNDHLVELLLLNDHEFEALKQNKTKTVK